jgi:hypothetical protein
MINEAELSAPRYMKIDDCFNLYGMPDKIEMMELLSNSNQTVKIKATSLLNPL